MQAKGIDPKTNMKVHGWAHEHMVYRYTKPTEEEILREVADALSPAQASAARGSRVRLIDFVNGERSANREEENSAA